MVPKDVVAHIMPYCYPIIICIIIGSGLLPVMLSSAIWMNGCLPGIDNPEEIETNDQIRSQLFAGRLNQLVT